MLTLTVIIDFTICGLFAGSRNNHINAIEVSILTGSPWGPLSPVLPGIPALPWKHTVMS